MRTNMISDTNSIQSIPVLDNSNINEFDENYSEEFQSNSTFNDVNNKVIKQQVSLD